MKRVYLPLLAACALSVLPAFRAPFKPKAQTVGLAVVAADSATVSLSATVSITGQMRPTDLIRYNSFKDGGLIAAASKDTQSLTYTAVVPAPTCGTTGSYQVKVKMVYNGVVDTKTVSSAVVSYAAPQCPNPPPVIDSVRTQVSPISATVAPGGSVQFTVSTNSGKPVTWRVVGVGTVSSTGLYTAPL